MVTVVGVAYRGGIPLEDIEVDFAVEPVERADSLGFGVRELVTLRGSLSESERVRLERAVRFCPVGQALTKGAMVVEDEVQWRSGEVTALPVGANPPTLDGALPVIPPGTVHGSYLLDTKEYDESGAMHDEGEAKIYVTMQNLTRSSRWTLLAGHSSDGWVPPPFPTAQAGWAASTATTLSRLLPLSGEADVTDLAVEVGMGVAGGRDFSQGNAAAGRLAHRSAVRRIVAPGNPRTMPVEAIQAALLRDPISIAYTEGGILLDEQVIVE